MKYKYLRPLRTIRRILKLPEDIKKALVAKDIGIDELVPVVGREDTVPNAIEKIKNNLLGETNQDGS